MIQKVEISVGFGFSVSKCGGWVIWPGFEVSPPVCWCWVAWLGFEASPSICGCFVAWLGFEVSCKPDMGLWCCSNRVSSMLMGFSTVMVVVGLELKLLAWVSALSPLCSLPSNLNVILPSCFLSLFLSLEQALLGIKARSPSTSNNQAKQTLTMCNAILTGTDLRVGSKSLRCKVGLLFHCFL